LYYSNNVIVTNNSVSNHDNGINIKGDLNLIINNKISLSHNIGINIDERYSNYNVIDNNLCELNKIGLQLSYSNMNTVHSNELLHNSDTVLVIQPSNQNAILNNTISSNDINGLISIGSEGNHIYLNRIEGIQNNISSDTNSNNYWHSPTELNYTFQKAVCKSPMGNSYHGITLNDINQDGISETPSQPSPYDKMDDYPLVFDKNQYQTNTLIFSNTGKIVSVSDLMGRPGITTLTGCESYVFLSKDPLLLTKIYSEKDHWSGQITFEKSPGTGDKFLVEIGCSENGIDFIHSGAEATIHCESDINQYQFISNNNAFIIKKGHYLAIRMKHIRKGGVFYSTYQYKMLTGSLLSYVVEPVPVDHPSIFSVHPMSCPAEGNQMITIKGTRFGEKPGKVLFGDVPAEKIIQWSMNSIECMIPAYSQGLVDIAVIKDNNSAAKKKESFCVY
jgi:parallel beta-helix repeat protein